MRIVTFTSLFPNPVQPGLGLFVAERLRQLLGSGAVEARIVAPVPWFPSQQPRFGKYAEFAKVPSQSSWEGLPVLHPKHLVIPAQGWYLTPWFMALAGAAALRQVRASGHDFELIDAHYYYPDGVAAALLGRWFKRPVVITARGTDVNLIPRYPLARRMVRWAARQASENITVSKALKDAMLQLGVPEQRVSVLRNGVDLQRFQPLERAALRQRLGLRARTLLSAGNLIELKGHHLVIDALHHLPDWHLLIAGKGELDAELRRRAAAQGVADRVHLVGSLSQAQLIDHYNAADALVLASSREGMPNVVLEALACGLPVIATAVGGTPEILGTAPVGRLLNERSAAAIAAAVRSLEADMPDRSLVRQHAKQFAWEATTRGQLELFARALRGGCAAGGVAENKLAESGVRDLVLTIFILGSLPWCFSQPHLGLLMWAWIGYMNPHRFSWGFAFNFPFVQIAALVTLAGMVLSSEKKRLPMSGVTALWLMWIGWTAVTTMFLLNPIEGVPEFTRSLKIQLMILITLLVITDKQRFNWLLATVAFSIGFFGVKGGAFVLATGGSYRVWGPPGTFIEGNNELALALLVVIPLMRYLQTQTANKWLQRGLTGAMALSGFAVVGSYSRGALLGGAAMLTLLWVRSRSKLMTLVGLVVVAGSALMFMPQQWFDRMNTIGSYQEDGSALGRINAWHFAYNLAKDRPITGGGFESFTPELFLRYAPNPKDFHDAHSIYFEVLAEHGFVGLFLFLGLAIAVMLQGQKVRRLTRGKEHLNWAYEAAGMLQVAFAGFGVGGAFLGLAYFDLPYHIMAMMIIVHAIVRRELQQSTVTVPAATYAPAAAMRRT